MNIAQRILHVGGRNNAAGYVEFGSIQAVEALVRQMLRDQTQLVGDTPVYLVATGETHEGQETYTRHDAPPPLCESERLYSVAQWPASTWHDCLAISELPAVDEALAALVADGTEDNAVGLVQAVIDAAAPPSELKQVRVWCETCDGTGEVHQESQLGVAGSGSKFPCPDCSGEGFNLRGFHAGAAA